MFQVELKRSSQTAHHHGILSIPYSIVRIIHCRSLLFTCQVAHLSTSSDVHPNWLRPSQKVVTIQANRGDLDRVRFRGGRTDFWRIGDDGIVQRRLRNSSGFVWNIRHGFREQGLKERKKEGFSKQIASSDTNLKNRVSRE